MQCLGSQLETAKMLGVHSSVMEYYRRSLVMRLMFFNLRSKN